MRGKQQFEKLAHKLLWWCNSTIVIYTMIMLSAFPFYLKESYRSARTDKYHFFVVVTLAMAIVVLAIYFVYVLNKIKYKSKLDFAERYNRKKLNAVDISLLLFWLITVISTICATVSGGEFAAFFSGSMGRNMGLLMITMLVVAYFSVSGFFCYKRGFFWFVLFAMAMMSIIAIVNYYYLDPLYLFAKYKSNANVIKNFTTTIGNKNYLSAMICVTLPLAMGLGIVTKDKITRVLSYICVGIQFMALIVATSDGGFLGCFAGIMALFVLSTRDVKRLSRFFQCAGIIVLSSKILWLFDLLMKGNNKGYTSFSRIFIYDNRLFILIPVFFGLAYYFSKLKDDSGKISKALFISAVSLTLVIVLIFVSLFVYFTSNTDIKVGEFTSFFRFDENWGTHRGFFWINAFEMFGDFTLREKLFGVGPDNFVEPFLVFDKELIQKYNETHADAAHNVYINYLITYGILGAVFYVSFIAFSLWGVIRNATKNPLAFAVVGAIVAFTFQDIVNIANPVNTPWLFILIAISQACYLKVNTPSYSNEVL
ncbi:MAG: O-antigen ligase family protein [Ruminococcaceae bacterium]|nr:O-antigen ligase family protein [Oscillospiraceae bacterium]